MKKICVCIGTRPEAIKMAPLILRLKKEADYKVYVCLTGQHMDMVLEVLTFFGIAFDKNFEMLGKVQNLNTMLSFLLKEFELYFEEIQPDLVLAQGDTTSVLAAALSAYHKKIPFGHIEAGLRTGNIYSPWPEEGNRLLISKVATYHFSPTEYNKKNLISESIKEESIYVTGNTVVDALQLADAHIHSITHEALVLPKELAHLDADTRLVLVTGHRRENLGSAFEGILLAILDLARKHKDVHFIFPVHLNPDVRKQVYSVLGEAIESNIKLVEPLSYPHLIWLLKRCHFVLTDSGGIQEEAPSFKKPILVTRINTERPEGVTVGVVKVVGTERESVFAHCDTLLTDSDVYEAMIAEVNPYGDGTAAETIVAILKMNL